MDIREAIRTQPMRAPQLLIVAICIVLTMIDGYEIIVMPFVVLHLAKTWALSPVQVGYLLSASVLGMALGAIFISPLADKIGRRAQILLCLGFITAGMLLSASSNTLVELIAYRTFAGLFIGGVIASINVLVSEYTSDRRRGFVMGLYGIGFPLGSALAGTAIAPLLAAYGWRGPFAFGSVLTLAMMVAVFFALPESVEYLVDKRSKRALDQYNKIAGRLGYPCSNALPPRATQAVQHVALKSIFGGGMLTRTTFLWIGYAGLAAAFYFANTWTAKMVADASGNAALGVRAGMLVMLGGVLGALAFAALSLKFRPMLVTAAILFGGALTFVFYASQVQHVTTALSLAVLVGLFANGGIAAFYAISPTVYPAIARGTGVGLMIGFGRSIAVVAPIWTGYMLASGWTPPVVYQFFGAVLGVAALAIVLLDRTYTRKNEPGVGTVGASHLGKG
ncbi:MFS transporter [Burkholderia pseudomallei]|uniref:MFS transporter n=2 Tax=Burkholderia pseudomallei TaxID=28450 RepID=UPI00201A9EAE|nr:MFS transporter [Burkholderia pseudomallei]MCL4671132.1 MFS transporter [Burkholderia pseudomallei]